ncbi:MAG TPA: HAD-IB family hydrolase, partial [Clostridiaceae bacterium]|nr:HAD-IB family hydrolase [Clostridiaceae bacterium]
FMKELFKRMIRSEIIKEEDWYKEVKPYYDQYDRRVGSYDDYLIRMADIYTLAIKGYHRSFIEHIIHNVVRDMGLRNYLFTRNRIRWHKEQGHKLITISGSPVELVKAMAKLHDFDDYRGSVYSMDEKERYTGEVLPMWDSASKEKAIFEMQKKYDIDLSQSYAYGDTAGDFTMFKLVGHPVLVNPTRELVNLVLADEKVRKKAEVAVERKDLIYRVKIEELELEKK